MRVFAFLCTFFLSTFLFATSLPRVPQEPLPPIITVAKAEQPIVLSSLKIERHVVGSLAKSHITMQFYNPNNRPLEGMLEFPLRDNQSIEGFALESLDGKRMLASSAIEKEKGEQVFESIERRNADPALLSKTQGNNFKLRIYPLNAKTKRTVTLDIVEKLASTPEGYSTYVSPLAFDASAFKEQSIAIHLHGITPDSLNKEMFPQELQIRPSSNITTLYADTMIPKSTALLTWKAPKSQQFILSSYEDKNYFLAELPLPSETVLTPLASHIAIIWDASSSGAKRNHAKEFAFLDRYFKTLPKDVVAHVSLSIVRDKAENPKVFDIRQGDWSQLQKVLEKVPYDGATNASAWSIPEDFPKQESLALLFSDGLANWGENRTPQFAIPLFTIASQIGDNSHYLRYIAKLNKGRYINVLHTSLDEAFLTLSQRMTRIVNVSAIGAEELVLASHYPHHNSIMLAGILTDETATLVFEIESPSGLVSKKEVKVVAKEASHHDTFAAKQWARLSIDALEQDVTLHKAQIARLGKTFGLVSTQTSLIILETLEDYIRYDVMPPKGDLRERFVANTHNKQIQSHAQKSQHLEQLAKRFKERITWWEKEFPKDDKKYAEVAKKEASRVTDTVIVRSVQPSASVRRERESAEAPVANKIQDSKTASHTLSIQLQPFNPSASYAKRLLAAQPEQRYAIYLDEKPNYPNSTAFYLDMADIFFEKGETDLAIRILSNLVEMELENRQILRIVAYRLEQAKQGKLALPLLKKVAEISPFEPQSWRDLGLLEVQIGLYQEALNHLWEVASTPWDVRFADIDLIALGELNALIALHPELDISRIDKRFIRNLPLDLRAILTWDADNTDIDLWVIDPNDEIVYYGHRLSYQGGSITRDFTAGYGPEEFSLKSAKKGLYTIKAHFYGHRQQVLIPYTTLMLKLSTSFGTQEQKDQYTILRLKDKKEEILVGTFKVGE